MSSNDASLEVRHLTFVVQLSSPTSSSSLSTVLQCFWDDYYDASLLLCGGGGDCKNLHLKLNKQYSESLLQVCSMHAVSSRDNVVNSLWVKCKSSRGVSDRGM